MATKKQKQVWIRIENHEQLMGHYKARIAELEAQLKDAPYATVVKLLFEAHEQIAHLNGTL